ncbi:MULTISPECIES: MHYT domain-containing protein [unclassified Streptomyces]|uniref:MHYT domain-containing protein n=1 Tax=unclassified Streptomyces TaxID=2593676 RepID=UPI0037FE84BC
MGGTYGTVDGFTYGWATPLAGYLMACLGAGLGLRCITRALAMHPSRRAGWLALGAAAIGSGIWTMHFIAMMGFTIGGVPISYDLVTTLASLLVAVLVVGVGVFAVGYLGRSVPALLAGGVVMGLGIAGMHYLGMRGLRLHAALEYSTPTVALAVGVAVVAATVALWCAVTIRGLYGGLVASLILGLAMTCMHYIGMASVTVHLLNGPREAGGAGPAALAPVLIGPVVFLLLAGVVVALDPPTPDPYVPGRPTVAQPGRPAPASRAARASRVRERPGERH